VRDGVFIVSQQEICWGTVQKKAPAHWAMAEIATAIFSYLRLLEAQCTSGMRREDESKLPE
jgi:hypothetical protein